MSDVALWIDPPSSHFLEDRLFDLERGSHGGDASLAPFVHVRDLLSAHGVTVHTADQFDSRCADRGINLYVSTGMTSRFRRLARRRDVTLSAFIAIEAPIVGRRMYSRLYEASRVFRRMFACNRGGPALRPFLKGPVTFEPIMYPYSFDGVDDCAWARRPRSFLVMINANKALPSTESELYSERRKVIEFFGRTRELDLYGVGWDGPAYQVVDRRAWIPGTIRILARHGAHQLSYLRPDPLLQAARSVWRGPVSSKLDVLAGYHFSIVMENMALNGWITEKLFDCIRAGCIPIYLGAPDVDRWVPRECFIDLRAFRDYGELRAYLHSLGDRERDAYRDAGREFLGSERFKAFSPQAFADVFRRILAEDAGVLIDAREAVPRDAVTEADAAAALR